MTALLFFSCSKGKSNNQTPASNSDQTSQGVSGNPTTTPTPTPNGSPVTPTPTLAPSPAITPTPTPNSPQPSPTPNTTPTPIPGRPSSDANLTVCPGASTVSGIDVSKYDETIQWDQVYSAGKDFAYIKATEGLTIKNAFFAADWANAPKGNIIRGAYHYFHPDDDPIKQAEYFLSTMGPLNATDLPPMLDLEVTDGVKTATVISELQVWLNTVEKATGKIPVIYVGHAFWNSLGNPQGFQRYPLYIAEYEVTCPEIPPPWSTWSLWQPGIGPVAGVPDPKVDLDMFNGTISQLKNFATSGSPSPLADKLHSN